MPVQHFVDERGRYDGKTLQELWRSVVDEVVRAVEPLAIRAWTLLTFWL